jgi:hypothetical protein
MNVALAALLAACVISLASAVSLRSSETLSTTAASPLVLAQYDPCANNGCPPA